MYKLFPVLALFAVLLNACSPSPQPIEYGDDMCNFCMMTIVDQQHAAELVTTKGKVFKFDAIECMIQYRDQHSDTEYAFQLVNDYAAPKSLVAAETAHYLVSPALPSPMGAYLTAFAEEDFAQKMLAEKGGTLYNWNDIQQNLLSERE